MKKLLFYILLGFSSIIHAQITLPENKSYSQQHQEEKKEFNQVLGITRYNATIIGYSLYCRFGKKDIETVYNYFFSEMKNYNLSKDEIYKINTSFQETVKEAMTLGPKSSKLTCQQFNKEFIKILDYIKEKK